jgi:hypothetical protein
MFIESRILGPHVRRPVARWPGLCATRLECATASEYYHDEIILVPALLLKKLLCGACEALHKALTTPSKHVQVRQSMSNQQSCNGWLQVKVQRTNIGRASGM